MRSILSANRAVYCLELATGRVVLGSNVEGYKAEQPRWGFSCSLLIDGDLLIVNAGDSGIAFEKKTGAVAWSNSGAGAGYASP